MNTVESCFILYRRSISNTANVQTLRRATYALENFFSKFPEKKHVQDFHRVDVLDYEAVRKKDKGRKPGTKVSPGTIAYELAAARTFWNWLLDRELVTYNPISRREYKHKSETARAETISEEQGKTIVSSCESTKQRVIVLLPLTCGTKAEEAVLLRWQDVDLQSASLTIQGGTRLRPQVRTVPLPEGTLQSLRKWREESQPAGDETLVLAGMTATQFRWQCLRLGRRAGVLLSGVTVFRNSYASWLLRNGVDVGTMKKLMGYKQNSSVLKHFTSCAEGDVRAAVGKILCA